MNPAQPSAAAAGYRTDKTGNPAGVGDMARAGRVREAGVSLSVGAS